MNLLRCSLVLAVIESLLPAQGTEPVQPPTTEKVPATEKAPVTDKAPSPPKPKPAPAPTADQIAGQVQANLQAETMRRQMIEGRSVRSHVRVEVRLQNGNRIRGVVKDSRLVERVDGLRFVQADANDPGAGIRVWYYDGSNNYVFLPFSDIRDYRIQAQLTSAQLQVLEQQYEQIKPASVAPPPSASEAARQAEARAALLEGDAVPEKAAPKAPAPVAGKDGDAAKDAGKDAGKDASAEQKRLYALLQEFPPAAGWTVARRDEINRKQPVLHVPPTEQERKFLDSYTDWLKACTAFGVDPTGAPANGAAGSGSSGSNSSSNSSGDSRRRRR